MSALQFIGNNIRFLAAGILLTLTSCYGQTFFISIFAAQILSEFSVTNGEWGLMYTLGTTASALVMFWAGGLTDQFRVRRLAWLVMPGLALTCVAMSLNRWVPGLVLIVFFLRFFGQGMTFQLAAVSMARWFTGRRGLALSISSLGFWFGQAVLPVVVAMLLLSIEWRTLWLISAALILLTFPLILWLLAQERTPQSLALETQSTGMLDRHWTRHEVVQSRFFWLLMPLLIGPPAWGTALFFQQVHIAEVKGWALVEYLALIPLMTVVSVTVSLATGQLIDRFGSGRMLQFYPLAWIVGFLLLAYADTLSAAAFAFVVFGICTGMQATLITAFWAEYFGTAHLGSIKATSTSVMVFGSAVGPGISGVLIDLGYDFPSQMLAISAYFAIAMLCVWRAVSRARADLPATVEIDIERA